MIEHLSREQIENCLGRRSSRAEWAVINQHLFACEDCYQQFLKAFEIRNEFPIEIDLDELAGLKDWHLQGKELKAYVAGTMEALDLEYASLHLKECAWCREEVDDYSEFGKDLGYYISKRHSPPHQSTGWIWSESIFGAVARSPIRLTAAALVLLLVSSALVLWTALQENPGEQRSRLSKVTQQEGPPVADTPSASQEPALPSPPEAVLPDTGIKTSGASDPGFDSKDLALRRGKRIRRQQEIESDLIAKDLVMPSIIEIFDRSPIVLRGNGNQSESFNVISPYGTLITTDRPVFRWTALTGATSYTVSIYDARLNLIETSEPLTETEWPVRNRLRRGMVYTWIVTAIKDGKESLAPTLPARAEFKVIEEAALAELNRSINQSLSRAARGMLYANAGLLDEAEQELNAHIASHPEDERTKKLLDTIRSWRSPQTHIPPSPITTNPPQ